MIAIKNKKKGTVNDVLTFEEERRLLEIAKERAKIIEKGDSEEYLPGDIVDLWKIEKINKSLAKKGKKTIKFEKCKKNSREQARAISILIQSKQHLIKYMAKQYFSRSSNIEYDDLLAEGNLALPKAIQMFDLNSDNTLSTYAGYWITQRIQTFFLTSQLISQNPTTKRKRNIIYYDENNYQNDDKDNKNYSLIDRLYDNEDQEIINKQIYGNDIKNKINNLINTLLEKDEILVLRLYYKMFPKNLKDLFHFISEEEKKEIINKLGRKKLREKTLLADINNAKFKKIKVILKYLSLFGKKYTSSELSKTINKPENIVNKLKRKSLEKIQKKVKEENLQDLLYQ